MACVCNRPLILICESIIHLLYGEQWHNSAGTIDSHCICYIPGTVFSYKYYKKTKTHSSCEIEDVIETHLCKL